MKLLTTRFGEIEIQENSIFNFVSPILGYKDEDKFTLIEHNEKSNFKWLQSLNDPALAFPVTTADLWNISYSFELPDEAEKLLDIKSVDDLIAVNIVVIPSGNPQAATINLLAPLILNISNQKAGQFVLTGSTFSVTQPLLGDK